MQAPFQIAPSGRKRLLAAALTLALAGGAAGTLLPIDSSAAVATAPATLSNPQFADIVEAVQPAVVNISVSHVTPAASSSPDLPFPPEFEPFFRHFRGQPGDPSQRQPSEGLGSGFIVSSDGYVVTNLHVVGNASEITVTTDDGEQYPAELVGADPRTDLALLKVSSKQPFPHVTFGDSTGVRVGDWVMAIGNPFGLGGSVSAGIVSARGRDINSGPYDNYLQIDAPINRGNSGGPLFDTKGNVIGVNTAIFSPNGGNIGIGFAIPAETAQSVVVALKETGSVARGWLGVHIQALNDDLARNLALPDTSGALVVEIVPGSPAAATDLRSGDVIVGVNGQPVSDPRTLSRVIADFNPGTPVKLRIWRDSGTRDIALTLGNLASSDQPSATPTGAPATDEAPLGLTLAPLDNTTRGALDPAISQGVVVTAVAPDSVAAEKQISPGDVIISIDREEVADVDDAVERLASAKASSKHSVLLLVARQDQRHYVALPVT